MVPSLIAVAPRNYFKTEDLLPPYHRRGGAIAVLVLHKPQRHRHDRRGSAVVPSLITVAQRENVKTADLRGGTADTLNMFKTSAVSPRVGPISVGSPRHRHYRRGTAMTALASYKGRSSTSITAGPPQYNRCAIAKKSRLAPLRPCRSVYTAVMAVPRSAAANTAVIPPDIGVAPPSNRICNLMRSPCP